MSNVLPFTKDKVDPNREIVESPHPAPIIHDFTPAHVATQKRRQFHAIMNEVEIFGSRERPNISSREEIYKLLLYAMSDELKRLRYKLDYHALNALSFIATIVVKHLVEVESESFRAPVYVYKNGTERSLCEEIILVYVFTAEKSGSVDLNLLKESVGTLFQNMATTIRFRFGNTMEDSEKMYEHLSRIYPLVMDTVKTYMLPFKDFADFDLNHRANS